MEYKGFKLKTKLTELTVGEFEDISVILADENKDEIEKYMDVFERLGMPEDLLNNIQIDDFFLLVKEFHIPTIENIFNKSIELNGREYIAYDGDEYKIKVKDLAMIEKKVKKNNKNIFSYILAIIFKDIELTNEHYIDVHIEYKSKLFRDLISADYISYLLYVNDKVIKKIKMINETAS
jgi:hypothetical protein